MFIVFCYRYGDHRDLHVLTHAFPTRRSSDLADIIDSEVSEYEIVRARAQFEQFVAGGIARLPVGGARAGEMRAHGIAGGIDAAHHQDRKSTRLNSSH